MTITRTLVAAALAATILAVGAPAAADDVPRELPSPVLVDDYAIPLPGGAFDVLRSFGLQCPAFPGDTVQSAGIGLRAPVGVAVYAVTTGKVTAFDEGAGTLTLTLADKTLITYSGLEDILPYAGIGLGAYLSPGEHIGFSGADTVTVRVRQSEKDVDPLSLFGGIEDHARWVYRAQETGECTVQTASRTALLPDGKLRSQPTRILDAGEEVTLRLEDPITGPGGVILVPVVTEDGTEGYVHDGRLAREGRTTGLPANVSVTVDHNVYRTVRSVPIYSVPQFDGTAGILGMLHPNEMVEATGRVIGNMHEVLFGAETGWVELGDWFSKHEASAAYPAGYLDEWAVEDGVFTGIGWGANGNTPTKPGTIRVKIDGAVVDEFETSIERLEMQVKRRNITTRTAIGFEWSSARLAGEHQVSVEVVGTDKIKVLFDETVAF